MEFKAFPKIENIGKIGKMVITQKIHGTNAQIFIIEIASQEGFQPDGKSYVDLDGKTYLVLAGSRTRWIYPGDDNYGFAAFVEANKKTLIKTLGKGQHFGEWAGPGINSGEGLKEKTFVLFDHWKFPPERILPPQTVVVPVLYEGKFDFEAINSAMEDLKTNGSKLQPGFMRPEGVVVSAFGQRFKKVFNAEETEWKKPSSVKAPKVEGPSVAHLLQPIRLEKLLSKDERYTREYPNSLPQICSDYIADLIEEGQITGNEDDIRAIRKALGSQLFKFVKAEVNQKLAS